MTPASISPWRDTALQAALFTLGLFLPFSSAGVSLSLFVLLVMALAAAPAVWHCRPWREPTVAIGLVLLVYIAVHTLVFSGWSERSLSAVNKYHELLMLPILFALFRLVSRREVFLWGLAAGALGYALAYWIRPFDPQLFGESLDHRRISAGFVLAVFSFVLVDYARTTARPRLWWALAAVLAATALFRVEGRTGHLVLLVLAAVAAWIYSPARWRLGAAIALPLLVAAVASLSPAVQTRAMETWRDVHEGHVDGSTSTGIRMALTASGLGIARHNLPFGVGYARYAEVQERYVQQTYGDDPAWKDAVGESWVNIPNPHDEFLLQAACGGVIPLLLFIGWLLAPALRARPSGSALLPAVVIAFAVGCAVNSLLLDFVEGHFYTALLAWLLAREASARAP